MWICKKKMFCFLFVFFEGFFWRVVAFFLRTSKMILSQTRTKTSLSVLHATLINFILTFVMALTLVHRLVSYQSKTDRVPHNMKYYLDSKSGCLVLSSQNFFLLCFTNLQWEVQRTRDSPASSLPCHSEERRAALCKEPIIQKETRTIHNSNDALL